MKNYICETCHEDNMCFEDSYCRVCGNKLYLFNPKCSCGKDIDVWTLNGMFDYRRDILPLRDYCTGCGINIKHIFRQYKKQWVNEHPGIYGYEKYLENTGVKRGILIISQIFMIPISLCFMVLSVYFIILTLLSIITILVLIICSNKSLIKIVKQIRAKYQLYDELDNKYKVKLDTLKRR